jgi:hypothetical protein
MRLNKVYPFIGDNAGTPTKVDFGNINAAALTTPTATIASTKAITAGMGFLEITINGVNRNLLMCLD